MCGFFWYDAQWKNRVLKNINLSQSIKAIQCSQVKMSKAQVKQKKKKNEAFYLTVPKS